MIEAVIYVNEAIRFDQLLQEAVQEQTELTWTWTQFLKGRQAMNGLWLRKLTLT